MREEKLNERLIKFELKGICDNCNNLDKVVPIIREMLSEEYKTGLEQERFDKNMLEQELQEYKENHECILKQRDDITKNATEQIESLIDEKNKYKSLYENEKDKNDTLKRIINRCVEEIYNLIDDCDSVIGNKESSIVSKNKLMLMQKEKIIKILDLLKEIK